MIYRAIIAICFTALSTVAMCIGETSEKCNCEKKLKLYADLCYDPSKYISRNMTLQRFNNPELHAEEWPIEFGDAAGRMHLASTLTGRPMAINDDYESMCLKIHQSNGKKEDKGLFSGFGHFHASDWKCTPSKDFKEVYRCSVKSTLTEYHDEITIYFTDTEEENIFATIMCFANGEVGWHSLAFSYPLTGAEQKIIQKHVENLGFTNNLLPMYTENCN